MHYKYKVKTVHAHKILLITCVRAGWLFVFCFFFFVTYCDWNVLKLSDKGLGQG